MSSLLQHRVSLCSPGWPQNSQKSVCLCLKGVCHHTQLSSIIFYPPLHPSSLSRRTHARTHAPMWIWAQEHAQVHLEAKVGCQVFYSTILCHRLLTEGLIRNNLELGWHLAVLLFLLQLAFKVWVAIPNFLYGYWEFKFRSWCLCSECSCPSLLTVISTFLIKSPATKHPN